MAVAEQSFGQDTGRRAVIPRNREVVLGGDLVAPERPERWVEQDLYGQWARRRILSFRTSPLTRKIITFNQIALTILVAGILYLNSTRESLAVQRAQALVVEAELVSNVFKVELPRNCRKAGL